MKDTKLRTLENKLHLDDTSRAFMTIAMHTNPRESNLYNVKQMKHYFMTGLKIYRNGKHEDYEVNITGLKDFKKDLLKTYNKSIYKQLISNDYHVVKRVTNKISHIITNWKHNYAKKYGLPINIFDNFFNQHNYAPKNSIQKDAMINFFSNMPKKVELAVNILNLEHTCFSSTHNYLDTINFLNYFDKHPNTEFIPNPNETMADLPGNPNGDTPKECKQNTIKYFKKLNQNVPMSPFQVIRYCEIHLDNLNKQIRAVAKRHPRIHYKKFLTNDIYNLSDLVPYASTNQYGYTDADMNGFDYMDQRDMSNNLLIDDNNNYHWVLSHLTTLKLPYVHLLKAQKDNLDDNDYSGSLAKDIIGKWNRDSFTHQLTSSSTWSDFINHTPHGKAIKKSYIREIKVEKLSKLKHKLASKINLNNAKVIDLKTENKSLNKKLNQINKLIK